MIKEDFEKIKYSEQFKAIVAPSYLVSCFLNDVSGKQLWEYNFYSRETENIYTFIVDNDQAILRETNVLLNKKDNPKELYLGNLKLNSKEVIAIVNYFLIRGYKDDSVSKIILSIEMDETIIWSVIVILRNLKLINIKVNDRNSEVIENKVISPLNT